MQFIQDLNKKYSYNNHIYFIEVQSNPIFNFKVLTITYV
jgi:hypothetical protein